MYPLYLSQNELLQSIGDNDLKKSLDAQFELCKAIQPIFEHDVLQYKTILSPRVGTKTIISWVDWNKKYAVDCRLDVILKGYQVLVENMNRKMELYSAWCDCILIPKKNLPIDRFGIEAHILVVE